MCVCVCVCVCECVCVCVFVCVLYGFSLSHFATSALRPCWQALAAMPCKTTRRGQDRERRSGWKLSTVAHLGHLLSLLGWAAPGCHDNSETARGIRECFYLSGQNPCVPNLCPTKLGRSSWKGTNDICSACPEIIVIELSPKSTQYFISVRHNQCMDITGVITAQILQFRSGDDRGQVSAQDGPPLTFG